VYGELFLMKLCLALCSCLIEKTTQFDELFMMFKSVGKQVTEQQLFDKIESIRLTERQYERVVAEVRSEPNLKKLT